MLAQGQEQLLAHSVKKEPAVVEEPQAAEPSFTAIVLAILVKLLTATKSLFKLLEQARLEQANQL